MLETVEDADSSSKEDGQEQLSEQEEELKPQDEDHEESEFVMQFMA